MKNNRFSKRLLAVAVSVLMLVGAIVVPMTAVASTPIVDTPITSLDVANGYAAQSIIKDKKPVLLYGDYYGDNSFAGLVDMRADGTTKLTDGTVGTGSGHADFSYANQVNSDGNNMDKNIHVAWAMDGKATVNGFMLFNRATNSSAGDHSEYEVYVGDDLQTLFTAANKVHTYTAADGAAFNGVYNEFTNENVKSGYYVGVKLLDACSHADTADCFGNCSYHRISEIAFLGSVDTTDKPDYVLDSNFFYSGYSPSKAYDTDGDYTYQNSLVNTSNVVIDESVVFSGNDIVNKAYINDGNISNQVEYRSATDKTVTFKLGTVYEIKKFSYWHQQYSERKDSYEIYVGNDEATLYNAANKVFAWNAAASLRSMRQDVTFNKEVVGKFVGIKFTDPDYYVKDGGSSRMAEFAVWGSANTKPFIEKSTTVEATDHVATYKDSNLLSGKALIARFNGERINGSGSIERLTNDDTSIHADIYDGTNVHLAWNLDYYSNIDHLLVYNRTNYADEVSYQFYIADDFKTLFATENMVYEHVADANNPTRAQVINIPGGKKGYYVGMIITNPGSADGSARISEIAAYGSKDELKPAPYALNTLYTSSAYDATGDFTYDKNLLVGLTPTIPSAGNRKDGFADNSFAEIEIWDAGTAGKETVTFTLANTATIDAFQYWHSKTSYVTTLRDDYEIYVGSDLATLYDATNRVFEWENVANPQSWSQRIVFTAQNKPKGKYIGIKYTDGASGDDTISGARAAEFAAWGKLDEVTGAVTPITDQIIADLADQNLIAGKLPTYWYTDTDGTFTNHASSILPSGNTGITKLTDNSLAIHADVYSGLNKRIVFKLDGYSQINAFTAVARNAAEEIGYKVYVADSLAEMFESDNLVYTFTPDKTVKGKLVELLQPAKGYYVAIEITDISGSPDANSRLQEIAFYGAALTGGVESAIDQINANYYYRQGSPFAYDSAFTLDTNRIKGLSKTAGSITMATAGNRNDTGFGDGVFDEIELWDVYKSGKETVTFALAKRTNVEAIQFWASNKANDVRDSYDIYVSDDLSTLYTDANKVFSWDATLCAVSVSQRVTFKTGKEPVGSYVGIKFTDPYIGADNNGAHMSEFAVWGTDAAAANSISYDLTIDDAVNKHASSLIAGRFPSTTNAGSANWQEGLTDGTAANFPGKTSSWHDIYNKNGATDTEVNLTYSLEYPSMIQGIAIWETHPTLKNGFDVYVGTESGDALFSAANKVGGWSALANPTAKTIYIQFAQEYQKEGRYVGIKFTDHTGNTSVRVAEIQVYGYATSNDNSGVDAAVGNGEIPKLYGSNLLVGRVPDMGKLVGSNLTGLADGLYDKEVQIYDATVKGDTITYDLTYPTTFQKIGAWHSNANRRVSYQVFVGNDKETLYDGTPIFTWDGINNTSLGQIYTLNSNAPITARYVGFKITDADSSGDDAADHARIARFYELYVAGIQDMSTVQHEALENLDSIDGTNLLAGIVPTVGGTAADAADATDVTDATATAGKGLTVKAGDKIVFNIGRSANLAEFILSADKTLGRYGIYVANAEDELFRSTNCVYTVINTADVSKITKVVSAIEDRAMVGIYVIDPSFDDAATNVINEVFVKGVLNSYVTTYPAYPSGAKDLGYGAANLLDGLRPTITYLDGRNIRSGSSKNSPIFTGERGQNLDWFTDDLVGPQKHTDIYFFDAGHITYNLGQKKYDMSGFEFYYYKERPIAEYEVYVSNSESTLYNPENKVITYVNENNSWAQSFKFADGEHPVGKFLGIKILNANDVDDSNPRIAEIVLLGEEYIPQPTNLGATAAVKGYVEKNGKITELTHDEFTTEQRKNFLNGDNDTAITIDQKGGTLHFVADLCAPMNIKDVILENISNSSKYVKSFKLYASDFPDEVWQDSTLVYTYNRDAADGQTVTIPDDFSGRYIRIEIVDAGTTDDTFNVNNFQFIGLDDQALDVTNQLYNIGKSAINFYGQNNQTYDYASIFGGFKLEKLYDNSNLAAAGIWGAAHGEANGEGEESTNIVYKFDNAKSISEVQISTLIDKVYKVDDVEVYLANSIIAIMDKTATPIATYYADGSGVNSYRTDDGNNLTETTYLSFESTEALYLRIRINDAVDKFYHRDSKQVAIAEIKAIGVDTANVDIGGGGAYSAEFTDAATGISAKFSTLSVSDVYRGVTKMTVSRTAVTPAMKDTLKDVGFSAVGEAYTLKFYDYLGNEVTDFGGRTVYVTIPYDQSLGMAYLAGYYDGEFTLLNSGFEGELIAYEYPEVIPNTTFVLSLMDETLEPGDGEEDDTLVPDEDETPDDTDEEIGDDDDYGDDTDDGEDTEDTDGDAEEDDDETESSGKKKIRRRRIVSYNWTNIILLIVGCVLGLAAIVTVVIIIIRKRKTKN